MRRIYDIVRGACIQEIWPGSKLANDRRKLASVCGRVCLHLQFVTAQNVVGVIDLDPEKSRLAQTVPATRSCATLG